MQPRVRVFRPQDLTRNDLDIMHKNNIEDTSMLLGRYISFASVTKYHVVNLVQVRAMFNTISLGALLGPAWLPKFHALHFATCGISVSTCVFEMEANSVSTWSIIGLPSIVQDLVSPAPSLTYPAGDFEFGSCQLQMSHTRVNTPSKASL